jgi:hypothetical protein
MPIVKTSLESDVRRFEVTDETLVQPQELTAKLAAVYNLSCASPPIFFQKHMLRISGKEFNGFCHGSLFVFFSFGAFPFSLFLFWIYIYGKRREA